MSEWKEYKVSEIAEVVGGGTPKTEIAEYWNGNIPWITPRDLSGFTKKYISKGERNITELGLKNSNARLLPNGTVLMSSRAPIGYLAIAENPVTTNQGFQSLIPNEKTTTEFLYYLIKKNVEYLISNGSGTTFGELSKSTFKELVFKIPSLKEQTKIAEVLSSLDDKIDLLHRQNKTLEQLAETLFRQWFVEEAEESWEIKTISDIIEVRDGTHESPKQTEFGKYLITSRHLKPNGIDFATAYKISEEDYIKVNKRSQVNKDDILFSMIGTLGLIHYVDREPDFAIKNMGLFKSSQKPYFANFLFLLLKSPLGKKFIYEFADGSTQEYITLGSLRNFEFKYPGENIIEEFDNKVQHIFNKIKLNTNQIQTLTQLRDTLLPKLMSGDVCVK